MNNILIIALLLIYKFLSNLIMYFQVAKIQSDFLNLVGGENIRLTEKRAILKALMKRANVKDSFIPTVSNLGFGQLASYKVSVLDNFPNLQFDQATIIFRMMDDARGIFRKRCLDTFNPLYWVDTFLFLPKNILSYLGIDGASFVVKLFQMLYWLVTPVLFYFREWFGDLIISFINHL